MITTSRLVEDAVVLLKERGIDDITIGEGLVTLQSEGQGNPCARVRDARLQHTDASATG